MIKLIKSKNSLNIEYTHGDTFKLLLVEETAIDAGRRVRFQISKTGDDNTIVINKQFSPTDNRFDITLTTAEAAVLQNGQMYEYRITYFETNSSIITTYSGTLNVVWGTSSTNPDVPDIPAIAVRSGTVEKRLQEHAEKLVEISADVTEVSGRVDTNTGDIATNATAIEANAKSIADLDARVTKAENDIEAGLTEEEIKDILNKHISGDASYDDAARAPKTFTVDSLSALTKLDARVGDTAVFSGVVYSCTLGANYSSNGLELWINHGYPAEDAYGEDTIIGGKPCRKSGYFENIVDDVTRWQKMMYFNLSAYASDDTPRKIDIKISYYDIGTGAIAVRHPSVENPDELTKTPIVNLNNSRTWKEAVITIDGMRFRDSINKQDFRFVCSTGTEMYISDVCVFIREEYINPDIQYPTKEIYMLASAEEDGYKDISNWVKIRKDAEVFKQHQQLKQLARVTTTEECTAITIDGLNVKSGVMTVVMSTSGETKAGCNLGINGQIIGGYAGDPKSGVYFIIWKADDGTYKARGKVGAGYNNYSFRTVSGDITSITIQNPYHASGGVYGVGTKISVWEGGYPYGIGHF